MFRVRDFSRLTRVTIKTLRHYDRLGLLVPAFVDPVTRYRHYAAQQVVRLHRIRALRDLGFSLEQIGELLGEDSSGPAVRRLLKRRRAEIAAAMVEDARRLAAIDATLEEFDRREPVTMDVAVRGVPPVRVATRRARVADLDSGAEALFEAVEADAAKARARLPGPPLLLYHDRDHRETGADIEAAVPVGPAVRSVGRSKVRTLPGHAAAACVLYRGDYDQWAGVARGLADWLARRRLTPAGPMREVYLQFGARDPRRLKLPPQYLVTRAEDLLTEVQIPVSPAAKARPVAPSGAR
jgi:DNA-binding transcriptional MerR regulator/effector-binding domain-containing protein